MSSLVVRIFAATSAQIAATGVVIFSTWAYWRLYGKEAWPVLLPSLLVAFVVEAGAIFAVLRKQRRKISLPQLGSTIIASWLGGLTSFFAMEPIARSLYYQTPKIAWIVALGILLLLVQRKARNPSLAREFSERQVWSYETRDGEEDSTLLINKVENDPKLGQIFHISILGVRVRNRRSPSGMTTQLPHFPVSKQTLEASCTKVVGDSPPIPGYFESYAKWKRASDQGRAGVFTIPVSEIVQGVENMVNK